MKKRSRVIVISLIVLLLAGIITPDCDSISYQYEKNAYVNSGKTFNYKITVNDKAGKFDYRIFQPIFELKFPSKQNAEYLSTMRVQDGDAMNYDEIKEYVKWFQFLMYVIIILPILNRRYCTIFRIRLYIIIL